VANESGVPSVIKVSDSVIGRLKEANEAPQQKRVQEKPAEVEAIQPPPVEPIQASIEPIQAPPEQLEAPPVIPVVEAPPVVPVVEAPPVVPVVEAPPVVPVVEAPPVVPVVETPVVPVVEAPVAVVAAVEEPPAPAIPEPTPHEQPPAFPQQPQQVPNNYFFPEEAHLALLRLRQERELELKKVEDYWRERLKTVESKYVNLNKLTSEEFAKSVAEVEQLYKKETCGPICQGMENSVIKCYQENPKQSLVCSPIVKDFSQCVASASLSALSSTAG